ncbi:hypothetical protein KIW84_033429 [Lathyrus oleraceus]|uniref:Retrotransposon gag domain-containing protein n=1 Tax=Pisum sativum TaxID=3888 RepID=A0A9D5B3R8_PEA|nr:hypothetical protein KIW84_033429 [Pisum sativum]
MMEKEADMSVTEYYTKFKSLFDERDELQPLLEYNSGASKKLLQRKEEHRVHMVLGDLDNEQFSQIKGIILNANLLPSLRRVFKEIQRDESRHTTDKEKSTKIEMSYVFYSSKTEKSKWKDNSKLKCDNCEKIGHIKAKYFEIIGNQTIWESRRPQRIEQNKIGCNGANFAQAVEKKNNTDGSISSHPMHGIRVQNQVTPHDKMTDNPSRDNGTNTINTSWENSASVG